MPSHSEENYLKAIFSITRETQKGAPTNSIAELLNTKASSVTDMVKRLADKKWVNHRKYQGVTLTAEGRNIAINTIRKHRLWEFFLVEHLQFKWDEVHDIAEQLEHIRSVELTNRLDAFLGHPKYDPHGDPIPDESGQFNERESLPLCDLPAGAEGIIIGVNDSSTEFLRYLETQGLMLGTPVKVKTLYPYDRSMEIDADNRTGLMLSLQVCKNLCIKKINQEK